jgi:hypothetical protein
MKVEQKDRVVRMAHTHRDLEITLTYYETRELYFALLHMEHKPFNTEFQDLMEVLGKYVQELDSGPYPMVKSID